MATQVPVIPLLYGAAWDEYSTKDYTGWPTQSNQYNDPVPNPTLTIEYMISASHARPREPQHRHEHTREAPGRTSGRAPAHNAQDARDCDLLAALTLDDKVRLLTGADNWRTCPLPAIGLRAMVVSDGPAGVRGITMDERNPSASLPCPSALGATWDPALVQRLGAALGTEARSKGVDILLAPTINVMRTPLSGRGFESFGEDPVLISRLAVAFVCGLHQAGAAAAVKHYVGNDSETQRWTYDARIAEHVLHELYLAPFEACVREADVDLVMTGLQQGQRRHDDRTRPAAHPHPQGRMELRRGGPV